MGKQGNTDTCPMCGAQLPKEEKEDMVSVPQNEKHTYYYYQEGGGTLDDMLFSGWTPLYTFEAVDMKDAERQLREVLPNSPLFNNSADSKVQCPYCLSKEIQLVPKKFSLLTGFATNRFDRMCVRCKRRF